MKLNKLKGVLGIALTLVLLASLTVGLAGAPAGAASSNLKFTELELPKVEDWVRGDEFSLECTASAPAQATVVETVVDTVDISVLNEAAGTDIDITEAPPGTFTIDLHDVGDSVLVVALVDGAEVTVTEVVTEVTYAEVNDPFNDMDGDIDGVAFDMPDGILSQKTFAESEGDFWCTPELDPGPIAQTPDGDILFAGVTPDATGFSEVLKSNDGYSWTVTGFYEYVSGLTTPDLTTIVDIVTSPEYDEDTTICVATEDFVYISDDGGKEFTQLATPTPVWGTINDLDMTIAEDGDQALMVGTDDGDVYVTKGLLAWTAQGIPGAISDEVLACAFLPTFADDGDIGLCAIVTETGGPTTWMTFSFANISTGGEWGDDIADAPFADATMTLFGSVQARIAFPDDFNAFGIGNNVCFASVVKTAELDDPNPPPQGGSDAYKVICKEVGTSTAVDLNVRGVLTTLAPTATAITSIDVCGDAEAATILVGTNILNPGTAPEYWNSYTSEDSGDSWVPSLKCPTGGDGAGKDAMTRVLMAPDFCGGSTAYAPTLGDGTSAFHCTTNGGESWNQISLIDYASADGYFATPKGFSAYGYNADDTLWMITSDAPITPNTSDSNNGALWGRLDGKHWERILSYANPGVESQLFQLGILSDGSAMFASDLNNHEIYRSTDMGATWPKKISTKDDLTWVTPVSTTTVYTAHVGGEIWWSERSGTGWKKPDDSEIPGSAMVVGVTVMGEGDDAIVTCGTDQGSVFISSDGGETVERVGSDGPFAGGPVLEGADLGFADNGILYAVSPGSAEVMRCEVDLSDPGDAEWVRIDDNQEAYNENALEAASPPICLPPSGILYVADMEVVKTGDEEDLQGGLWRCTNPTADIDSASPPYFERENKGLTGNGTTGDMVSLLQADLNPPSLAPTFFFANMTAPYDEQVVMYTDILNLGGTPASPAADAAGVGLLPEGAVYPEVVFLWEEMAGASSYQYQVAVDPDFKTRVANDYTTSLASLPMDLQPNTTYYWRVRAANKTGDAAPFLLIGAPLISPWSETWKFKTAIGASMARPELQAPEAGEFDVPLSPTFEWSGIEWAEVYEYEMATNPATTAGGYFTEPLASLVGNDALVSTAWKCDITLDYEASYYWHVKAVGVDTDTPWSDVGTFTTIGAPVETTEPPELVIPPAKEITPAWIWAVVIIGAILVIAVIVLIVTTRRAP